MAKSAPPTKHHTSSLNPFERSIQKTNFPILGKKVKGVEKKVGKSREMGWKKREETLGKELKKGDKKNVFVDGRFGEKEDIKMEDKYFKRFQQERIKKAKFSVNEDNVALTHKGKLLNEVSNEISNEEDVLDDYEKTENDYGDLNEDQVADHFGGGTFDATSMGRKTNTSTTFKSDPNGPRTKNEIMKEVMNKSKAFKMERQKIAAETESMVFNLDNEFADIAGLLEKRKREDHEPDEFEKQARKFVFDQKAAATNRTKTDEEIAQEESDKLKQLETERLARMRNTSEKSRITDDDIVEGKKRKKEVITVDDVRMAYNKEKEDDYNSEDDIKNSDDEGSNKDDDDHFGDEDEDENEEGDDEDEDEDEDEVSGEEGYELDIDENDIEDVDDEMEYDSENDFPEESDLEELTQVMLPSKKKVTESKILKAKKPAQENDAIPYVFDMPEAIEDLVEVLKPYSAKDRSTVITRIRALHHASLGTDNKLKLQRFYFLLWKFFRFVCDEFSSNTITLEVMMDNLDILTVHIYEMSEKMESIAAKVSRDNINSIQRSVFKTKESTYPTGSDLMIMKLIGTLYSVSDARHSVILPLEMLMSQCLTQLPVQSELDVAASLFIVSLYFSFVKDSKRYVPEISCYLQELLYVGFDFENPITTLQMKECPRTILSKYDFSPLPLVFQAPLSIWSKLSVKSKMEESLNISHLFFINDKKDFALRSYSTCVKHIRQMCGLYESVASFPEIIAPFIDIHSKITAPNAKLFHTELSDLSKKIVSFRKPLALRSFKPIPIRSLAPLEAEDRDADKSKIIKRRAKQEKRGAIRELKKDADFISLEKNKQHKIQIEAKNKKRKEVSKFMAQQAMDTNPFRQDKNSSNKKQKKK